MNDQKLIEKITDENDRNYEFNLSHGGNSFKIKFSQQVDNKIDPTLN
jgi:hypothetical protein